MLGSKLICINKMGHMWQRHQQMVAVVNLTSSFIRLVETINKKNDRNVSWTFSKNVYAFFILWDKNIDFQIHSFVNTQLIEKPTRRTLTTSSFLDVILTSRPETHISSGVIQTTFCDHYCVITVLDVSKPVVQKEKHNHIKFRDYKKFDKSAFLNNVKHSECFANVMTESDVIKRWGDWEEEFLKKLWPPCPDGWEAT